MAKKATEAQETGWVLVRANERLAGGPNGVVETGEEYRQPLEAAQFMAAQGWVTIVEAIDTSPEDAPIEDADK